MRDHVQCATWCEDGDLAIELSDRITRQLLLHILTRVSKGQCVGALKVQLTRAEAEAEAGDALLQVAANAQIRLVKLGDAVLLLPDTKQRTHGVLVTLAIPEATSIRSHPAAWVAQHPRTWHTKGINILAHAPQQETTSRQELYDQCHQSGHH